MKKNTLELGQFDTEEEAALAYNIGMIELYGNEVDPYDLNNIPEGVSLSESVIEEIKQKIKKWKNSDYIEKKENP